MQLNHHPPTPAAETLLRATRLVNAETGVIKMLYEAPLAPDAARIFGCAALCSDQTVIGFPSENEISGSTSLQKDNAIAGAIGEAVERYSAAYTPDHKILRSTYAELESKAIAPDMMALYSAEQRVCHDMGYRAPGPEDPIGWVEGWSLTASRPVLVPAFCVYQPYTSPFGESPVVQMVTTGLACGASREEAILAGLCEVIERDATMLLWLRSRRVPKVSLTGDLPPQVANVLSRFGRNAQHITLLDACSDIRVPTFVAVWDGPVGRENGAVFASCAKPTADAAAVGAITELAQCLMWADSLIDAGDPLPDPETAEFEKIEQHVLWPMRADSRPIWDFAVSSEHEIALDSTAATSGGDVLSSIETLVEAVASAGLQVVAVDVTSPDIADIGLHVVRVVVPGAQPLFFGRDMHRISARARTLAFADGEPGLNLHPHPYP